MSAPPPPGSPSSEADGSEAGSGSGLTFQVNINGKPVVPAPDGSSAESLAEEEEGNVYKVEHIRKHRLNEVSGKKEYFIKWKGYPESENTWEPDANIFDRSLIDAYNKERKKAKKALQKLNRREREHRDDVEPKPSSSLHAPNASSKDKDKKGKEMDKKHRSDGHSSGKTKEKSNGTVGSEPGATSAVDLPLAKKAAPATGFKDVGIDNIFKQALALGSQPSGVGSGSSVSVKKAAGAQAAPVASAGSTGLKDVGLKEMFKQSVVKKKNGFEKGYKVDKIIGVARKDSGEGFNFLVKWKPEDLVDDDEEVELLDSDLVKSKDTMAVLLYYECLVRVSPTEEDDFEDDDNN